jgi:hypothetical protein
LSPDIANESYDHHRGKAPLLRPGAPVRAGIFVGITFAGFVVAAGFWQYLNSGLWFSLDPSAFLQDLRTPLGRIFLEPLNLFTHPWMILVSGSLLTVLIFVPIIVAVLYRLVLAAPFVVAMVGVGHMSGLAAAVAVGCVLAARTRLRSDLPFLAVLLGLFPVGLYLYLFGLAGVDSEVPLPLQRWVVRVPYQIAIVAGGLASVVVLTLARLTRYRPGVVWPLVLVLLSAPLAVFYAKIGTDELDYSRIAGRLGSPDSLVESLPASTWRAKFGQGLGEAELRQQVEARLRQQRDDLLRLCDEFLGRHPRSGRFAAVLWVKVQGLSLQFDAGGLKYSAGFPPAESEPAWRELSSRGQGSPQAALADARVAELTLRRAFAPGTPDEESRGLVREAYERLAAAEQRLAALPETNVRPRDVEPSPPVFRETPAVPPPVHYSDALFAARRLRWLMTENKVLEDANAARVLSAVLGVDPRQPDALGRLQAILAEESGKGESATMLDRLKLEVAKLVPDANSRAMRLRELVAGQKGPAIEANYDLGMLLRQQPGLRADPNYAAPQAYFQAVCQVPANPWSQRAKDMLTRLATTRP